MQAALVGGPAETWTRKMEVIGFLLQTCRAHILIQ